MLRCPLSPKSTLQVEHYGIYACSFKMFQTSAILKMNILFIICFLNCKRCDCKGKNILQSMVPLKTSKTGITCDDWFLRDSERFWVVIVVILICPLQMQFAFLKHLFSFGGLNIYESFENGWFLYTEVIEKNVIRCQHVYFLRK